MHETERKYEYQNSAYSMKNGDYVVVKKKTQQNCKEITAEKAAICTVCNTFIHRAVGSRLVETSAEKCVMSCHPSTLVHDQITPHYY